MAEDNDLIVEAAIDIGTVNTAHCVLAAEVDASTGLPVIIPLDLALYPISDVAAERAKKLIERFDDCADLFSKVQEFDVEQQVPTLHGIEELDPKAQAGMRKAHAANVVAYGLAQAAMGVLTQKYPKAKVVSISPRSKFTLLGIHMPKSKPRKKTRARHFMHEWLFANARNKLWHPFIDKYISEDKRDDMADAFCTALGKIMEKIAKKIDLRRVKRLDTKIKKPERKPESSSRSKS